jgi:hypothetical protein
MGLYSEYSANLALDTHLGSGTPATVYLAALLEEPAFTDTGTTIVEPDAASYERLAITNNDTNWPDAADGIKSNGVELVHTEALEDWGTIRYWAICDAATLGNVIFKGICTQKTVLTNGLLRWPIGALVVQATG